MPMLRIGEMDGLALRPTGKAGSNLNGNWEIMVCMMIITVFI